MGHGGIYLLEIAEAWRNEGIEKREEKRILLYLITAIWLSPSGSSIVHIYTQTIHRTTQNKQYVEQHNNLGEYDPCHVLASYNLAFALN